jgi:hypothetical protein
MIGLTGLGHERAGVERRKDLISEWCYGSFVGVVFRNRRKNTKRLLSDEMSVSEDVLMFCRCGHGKTIHYVTASEPIHSEPNRLALFSIRIRAQFIFALIKPQNLEAPVVSMLGITSRCPIHNLIRSRDGYDSDVGPPGPEVADVFLLHRKEVRVPLKTFVNLSSSDDPSFEIAHTIDISCHGARVVTRRSWEPNQQLSIRSIRGSLKSLGRVAHCQPFTENRFVIGIEIYSLGDWTARDMRKAT